MTDAQNGWSTAVTAANNAFKQQHPGVDVSIQYQSWDTVLQKFGAALAAGDAVGAVLAAAYAGIAEGTWPRLKACRNCHWAFYDTSKNRSGTWCSMQLCGNRLKTRRFRSRTSSANQS
jgi:predicted RNA-binding Zn ribbon-like protein